MDFVTSDAAAKLLSAQCLQTQFYGRLLRTLGLFRIMTHGNIHDEICLWMDSSDIKKKKKKLLRYGVYNVRKMTQCCSHYVCIDMDTKQDQLFPGLTAIKHVK